MRDREGNLLRRIRKSDSQTTTFAFDYRNRMTSVVVPGSPVRTVEYAYDVDDRKVTKSIDGTLTEKYMYEGSGGTLALVVNASNGLVSHYVYGAPGSGDSPLAEDRPGKLRWLMPDHQGSVRQTLNQNGTVVTQQTAYDAFGRATPEVSESGGDPGSRFGYTGQERDFDTGLMDYGARWYDPMLGRFLSADPISEGTNDFAYVFNNPVNLTDPTGMKAAFGSFTAPTSSFNYGSYSGNIAEVDLMAGLGGAAPRTATRLPLDGSAYLLPTTLQQRIASLSIRKLGSFDDMSHVGAQIRAAASTDAGRSTGATDVYSTSAPLSDPWAFNPYGNPHDFYEHFYASEQYKINNPDRRAPASPAVLLQALSLASDAIPIAGTAKGIIEVTTGYDPVTGHKLSTGERVIAGVGTVASVVPFGKLGVRAGGKAISWATKSFRKVDDLPFTCSKLNIPATNPTVTWVDEGAGMSFDARAYNSGAQGARSNLLTHRQQAPSIPGPNRPVRFDGEESGLLIDRKLAVVTSPKVQNQALRQSAALRQNGLRGVWEVPDEAQAVRARTMLNNLEIDNIDVRVVPR